MTEQEQINTNVQRQIDAQNARIDAVMAKVDMLVIESQQQREDIRRLHERQDAAQAKHDAEMHEMNQRFYAKIDAMDAKIDNNQKEFTKQLHDNFVQIMLGMGAMIIALGGVLIAVLK